MLPCDVELQYLCECHLQLLSVSVLNIHLRKESCRWQLFGDTEQLMRMAYLIVFERADTEKDFMILFTSECSHPTFVNG